MQLGASGCTIKTFADIKVDYQTAYQDAYGTDIDLSEESVEGVLINKLTDLMNDEEQAGLDIYNGININLASGLMLSDLAILKGTQRNDGTKAVINTIFTSSSVPYTIAASTIFQILSTDILFQNLTAITVASTTQVAQLEAVANGLSGVVAGNQLQSQTYIGQLTDITIAPSGVTDGTNEESDAELRTRLLATDDPTSQGDTNAIYTALLNLDNVQKVNVLENAASSTDVNGIPPYSIDAIVLGDTDQNIIDTIYPKKSGGTPTYGAVSGTYVDIQGYNHTVYFDRPTKKEIYISCTGTAVEGEISVNGNFNTDIGLNCQSYIQGLRIGQNVSYSAIYGYFAAPHAFDIVSLMMSAVGSSTGMAASSVTIGVREYAELTDPTIDVGHTQVRLTIV